MHGDYLAVKREKEKNPLLLTEDWGGGSVPESQEREIHWGEWRGASTAISDLSPPPCPPPVVLATFKGFRPVGTGADAERPRRLGGRGTGCQQRQVRIRIRANRKAIGAGRVGARGRIEQADRHLSSSPSPFPSRRRLRGAVSGGADREGPRCAGVSERGGRFFPSPPALGLWTTGRGRISDRLCGESRRPISLVLCFFWGGLHGFLSPSPFPSFVIATVQEDL